MTDIQAHRGPDDSGLWETRAANGAWVGLGSRRLAILDLSPAGHMPMVSQNASCTLVYNGEIYNCASLRDELEKKGYAFRSRTDTEVVLNMYQEEGPDCVRRLNGIFAFAIWDHARQQLFLARDHFGIKPLYYSVRAGNLAFASEAKALLELSELRRGINLEALDQFMSFLWVPDPLTLFEGILKLPPAHCAVFKNGVLSVSQYWRLQFPPADHVFRAREEELAEELRGRFEQVVRSQLLSDVPLGAFLSAGLDSSSIVAAMCKVAKGPVRTFTITFPEAQRQSGYLLDDPRVAERTARHFGCQHTTIEVAPRVVDLWPKLVWHMDDPVADPALIMAYLVSREARKSVTVLLSGIGGDELFAGYRKYQAHYWAEFYLMIPRPLRAGAIEPLIRALPEPRAGSSKAYVRLAKKMVRSASLTPVDRFLMQSIYLAEAEKAMLYRPDLARQVAGLDARQTHLRHFGAVTEADFLNQMLYVDTATFMTALNLNYNDKMSMASSVEVRVPFLDWEFAQWTASNVPPALKLHRGTTKHILREAVRADVPQEVLRQKKAGFGAPVDLWLERDLRPLLNDLLGPTSVKQRGLFSPSGIARLIEEHDTRKQNRGMQLWQLLTLELWMRTFIDRKAP